MSDPVLHILLAVSDRPRHGYAIVQEIEERTDGRVSVGTGTLYSALKRLHRDELIEEIDEEGEEGEEGEGGQEGGRNRRTYRLTERGRAELAEQAARLSALVSHARQKEALPCVAPGDSGGPEPRRA